MLTSKLPTGTLIDEGHPLYPTFKDFYHKLLIECGKNCDEDFRLYSSICWTCFLAGAAAGADQVMKRVLGKG